MPTRARNGQNPNILDFIFTNEETMITEIVQNSPLGKSDHSVLCFDYNCYLEITPHMRTKYYYDRGDYSAIKEELTIIDWDKTFGLCENVNNMWLTFKGAARGLENRYVPHRDITIGTRKKGKVPLDR